MPTLLLELGCEELPASACREAEAQLPMLVRSQLGVEASHVYVTPRRIAFVVDELPETAAEQLVKGPPAERREQAAAGFAKRYGLAESDLEERDGHLWARVPGEPLRGEPLLDRMRAIVHGLEFGKSMRWDDSGHRFARPVRWFCEKLDGETLAGSGTSFGHRFTHGEVDDRLRAGVRRHAARRERRAGRRRAPPPSSSRRSTRSATGRTRSGSSRRSCTWSSGRSSSDPSSTSASSACPSA